ncbi:hypothetical protein KIPB_003671 [Kipferlia bialata]|uniref:Uncharacterized protein n=1 Tax=Kipferlia bialata TaxID=797122 RepID=A0A391NVD3_9EUKA|nr:hypothetical protein KIPB_003500 [Kipferlia bialata]GCA62463.1 hypothetical protein KIPB_003671 [Kipferlia bialata]|eukprot:g3500.t1
MPNYGGFLVIGWEASEEKVNQWLQQEEISYLHDAEWEDLWASKEVPEGVYVVKSGEGDYPYYWVSILPHERHDEHEHYDTDKVSALLSDDALITRAQEFALKMGARPGVAMQLHSVSFMSY